jgi:hypothetical protein
LSLIPFDDRVGVCLTNPTLVDFPNPTNEVADNSLGCNNPEEGMDQFHDSQCDLMQLQPGASIEANSTRQSTLDREPAQRQGTKLRASYGNQK